MIALFLLICFLLLAAIWGSLVTYCFFWYENAWSARLAPDGGAKLRRMVLSGLLSSIGSVFFIFVSYPLGAVRRLWAPKDIGAGQPVIILTHGLYHNASAWLLFRRRLRKAGFKNIFVMNYASFFSSFEETLKKFEEFVADARQSGPGPAGISNRPQSWGTFIQVLFRTIPGCSDTRCRNNFGDPAPGVQSRGFWHRKAGFKFALPWTYFHRT